MNVFVSRNALTTHCYRQALARTSTAIQAQPHTYVMTTIYSAFTMEPFHCLVAVLLQLCLCVFMCVCVSCMPDRINEPPTLQAERAWSMKPCLASNTFIIQHTVLSQRHSSPSLPPSPILSYFPFSHLSPSLPFIFLLLMLSLSNNRTSSSSVPSPNPSLISAFSLIFLPSRL